MVHSASSEILMEREIVLSITDKLPIQIRSTTSQFNWSVWAISCAILFHLCPDQSQRTANGMRLANVQKPERAAREEKAIVETIQPKVEPAKKGPKITPSLYQVITKASDKRASNITNVKNPISINDLRDPIVLLQDGWERTEEGAKSPSNPVVDRSAAIRRAKSALRNHGTKSYWGGQFVVTGSTHVIDRPDLCDEMWKRVIEGESSTVELSEAKNQAVTEVCDQSGPEESVDATAQPELDPQPAVCSRGGAIVIEKDTNASPLLDGMLGAVKSRRRWNNFENFHPFTFNRQRISMTSLPTDIIRLVTSLRSESAPVSTSNGTAKATKQGSNNSQPQQDGKSSNEPKAPVSTPFSNIPLTKRVSISQYLAENTLNPANRSKANVPLYYQCPQIDEESMAAIWEIIEGDNFNWFGQTQPSISKYYEDIAAVESLNALADRANQRFSTEGGEQDGLSSSAALGSGKVMKEIENDALTRSNKLKTEKRHTRINTNRKNNK